MTTPNTRQRTTAVPAARAITLDRPTTPNPARAIPDPKRTELIRLGRRLIELGQARLEREHSSPLP